MNQCQECSTQCKTCKDRRNICTSCDTNGRFPYYYKKNCLQECPSETTVLVDNVCQSCDSNCKTCEDQVDKCTSCQSHMKFDSTNNKCLDMCEEGTQIYFASQNLCLPCSDNCKTCSGSVSTCTSCGSGSVLNKDNICRETCNSQSQTPIDDICKDCELPCYQCSGEVNTCISCIDEYYLYQESCVQYCPEQYEPNDVTGNCEFIGLICPDSYTLNDTGDGCIPKQIECKEGYTVNRAKTACIPAPGYPIPFPFLFLTLCLALLVLGSYLKDKFLTKVHTCLILLISTQEILILLLIISYSGALMLWIPLSLSLIATLMFITSNIAMFVYYKKEIVNDKAFAKWLRLYPKVTKLLPYIMLTVNFKSVKMIYSGFFGLQGCMAHFDQPIQNFFKPMTIVTYFNIIFVYLPMIIADALIIYQVEWGYQLLILAIENLIITILIIGLTIWEFRDPEKLFIFGEEEYVQIKPKSYGGMNNVMSGIDMDESTLIRSKIQDEDYETELKKQALMSILKQVGKNFLLSQKKGAELGTKLDNCMASLNKNSGKLRRAYSLENIKEEDESWVASDNSEQNENDFQNQEEQNEQEAKLQRRNTYPLTSKQLESVPNQEFSMQLNSIKNAQYEDNFNNVYAQAKPPKKQPEKKKVKTASKRTQTYLRDLICIDEEDFQESDQEIVIEDPAEIDQTYTQNLINNLVDGLSESDTNHQDNDNDDQMKKMQKDKNKDQIPDFELGDIIGDFEIDDLGNFIILRGENNELLDKQERRVNRRGYLIDRFGNVINNNNQIVFKTVELDSDDEIPAPIGYEKRKNNLLQMGDADVDTQIISGKQTDSKEQKDLPKQKKLNKNRKKSPLKHISKDQSIFDIENVNEEENEESDLDSLLNDDEGNFQLNAQNEDKIINKVSQQVKPKKFSKNQQNASLKQNLDNSQSKQQSSRKKHPSKKFRQDYTSNLYPTNQIETSEQRKLYKLAESIGGFASQLADEQKRSELKSAKNQTYQQFISGQQLPFNEKNTQKQQQRRILPSAGSQQLSLNATSDKNLPPKPQQNLLGKIYGNMNDILSYEEKQLYENLRATSPMSSQLSNRLGRPESAYSIEGKRIKGMEGIYLQKFGKKPQDNNLRKHSKPKFRQTLDRFNDDPKSFLNDNDDQVQQNDVSQMVQNRLDNLQKQYMESSINDKNYQYRGKHNRKVSQTLEITSLDPIQKDNWIEK